MDQPQFNPYAAPDALIEPGEIPREAEEGRGVWRDGKTLVMSKYARLSSRCVVCDEPATDRLRLKLAWHDPLIYLWWVIFPIGVLIYFVLMIIYRRQATIDVPLCQKHRDRRRKGTLLAWLTVPLGLILIIVGLLSLNPEFLELPGDSGLLTFVMIVGGALIVLGGAITSVHLRRVVEARRIDKTHVWLNKISPRYLSALPPLPYFGDRSATETPTVEF